MPIFPMSMLISCHWPSHAGHGPSPGQPPGGDLGGQLDPRAVAELCEDAAEVALDGARAEEQRRADLCVRAAGGYQLSDLLLALGERAGARAPPSRPHAEAARHRARTVRGA